MIPVILDDLQDYSRMITILLCDTAWTIPVGSRAVQSAAGLHFTQTMAPER
jgi:hypothetical protein